ncbi:DUF397 domain-containing protein [Actinokineospora spheciospongiae]|uniref:DUF397 domain-containing protein n=1 Tax=Actinokineospora spheciospongiae TaxID=909613 RepID=UPI000D71090A|nr:DUF397 domain-containing protein [Actinokineospora spheciospongiae]PWW51973.1 uncharacterized protein DUF397 [Actinokineospora spheciospongiae]
MRSEPLRFKKSQFSGGQSNCVEVAHTLAHLRDSKQGPGAVLLPGDAAALIAFVKAGRISR